MHSAPRASLDRDRRSSSTARPAGASRIARFVVGSLVVLAGACNLLTGADQLSVGELGAGGATSTTGPGGSAPTSSTTSAPAGGGDVGGSSSAGGSGAHGGAGAGEPTAGTGGVSTGGSGTGGSPPVDCNWPAGPYGVSENDVLAEGHSWQGYPAHSGAQGTVPITDFFDCDGSRGIHAVLLTTEQWTCGNCQSEAGALEGRMPAWEAAGIRVAILLITGPDGSAPSMADLQVWKNNFGLESVAVLADPAWTFVEGSIGTPLNAIVDPRTMRITAVTEGYSGSYPELEALADQNGP